MKPRCRRVNPDEATTDWRAVCGKTACTVRRAGRARALSAPYAFLEVFSGYHASEKILHRLFVGRQVC